MPRTATITTLPTPANPPQEIPLIGMHASGKAIGRLSSGKPIYINGGIPGEMVFVKRERRQQGFHSGIIKQLTKVSEYRCQAFCPHSSVCGACPWSHISYPGQLVFKREILLNSLEKYGIPLPESGVPAVHPSPSIFQYRNKAIFGYSLEDGELKCGFHPQDNPAIVFDCLQCALLPDFMISTARTVGNLAIENGISIYDFATRSGLLKSLLLRNSENGGCAVPEFSEQSPLIEGFMAVLKTNLPQISIWYYQVGDQFFHFSGPQYLEEKAGNLVFHYHPAAFYQPNPRQAENLFAALARTAAVEKGDFVYDLYTGIGTLASFLKQSSPGARILGIEGCDAAIQNARLCAKENNLDSSEEGGSIDFLTGDILETFTPAFIAQRPKANLVVLDPPRSGTLISIKKTILETNASRIVYVSCNPVSLAWDMKQLIEGGYRLDSLECFDMFPHTQHVETIACLSKE